MQGPKQKSDSKFGIRCIPSHPDKYIENAINNTVRQKGIKRTRELIASTFKDANRAELVIAEFDRIIGLMDYLEDYIRAIIGLNLPIKPGTRITVEHELLNHNFIVDAIHFRILKDGRLVTEFHLDTLM